MRETHYSFKSLLEAIRQNPAGDYICANLSASEVTSSHATADLSEPSLGLCPDWVDGTQHAIYNLVAPLTS